MNFKSIRDYLYDRKSDVDTKGNDLFLYGEIGSFVDENKAKNVIDKINKIKGDITVHVNSEGGNVFDGIAIMNALKQHEGRKNFIIEGLSASIAGIITLGAADSIKMMNGSCLMLHKAWTLAIGNEKELAKQQDILKKIDSEIVNIAYNKCRTNLTKDDINRKFEDEWWIFADEAKRYGFCDEVDTDEASYFGNMLNLTMFNSVPQQILNGYKAVAKPKNERELEAYLKAGGFSAKEAKAIISKGYNPQRDAEESDNTSNEMLLDELLKHTRALAQ